MQFSDKLLMIDHTHPTPPLTFHGNTAKPTTYPLVFGSLLLKYQICILTLFPIISHPPFETTLKRLQTPCTSTTLSSFCCILSRAFALNEETYATLLGVMGSRLVFLVVLSADSCQAESLLFEVVVV